MQKDINTNEENTPSCINIKEYDDLLPIKITELDKIKKECHHHIIDILNKYSTNDYMINRVFYHLTKKIPHTLELEEKNYEKKIIRNDFLTNEQQMFIQLFLNEYKIHRPNSIHVIDDAQQIDYSLLLKTNNVPQNIDYLQIDLDVDNYSTLNTLLKIDEQLFSEYKFATITFEHDIYSSDDENDIWGITRKKSREIFENRGYVLIFPDVQLPSNTSYRGKQCGAFEDWYVHPDLVDIDLINK